MIVPKEWEFNTDKKISDDEYDVLKKFCNLYRGKDVIVADEHRMDFNRVPFEGDMVTFKSNDEPWKSLDFQRRIVHKGKPYIVRLGLWRINPPKDEPQCLTLRDFDILTPGKEHVLRFSSDNFISAKLFYNILDIFDEKKIISPEAAYSERMYVNKGLQKFINNHEWGKIAKGIDQKPSLANALFIIGEPKKNINDFYAHFGTILYQLITYRNENEDELTKSDLIELDRLILQLSKTELLKVDLRDSTGVVKLYPTESILLGDSYSSIQTRISKQYSVANGELMEEKKELNKIIRKVKNR